MYLVGIDVGTTNTKTVIFDVETGRICAVGSSRTITRHPVPEWSEFDAKDVWGTVLQSIQAAVQHCDRPERIRAIAVASMGESAFPRPELVRALMEGLAFWLRDNTEMLSTLGIAPPQPEITVIGGTTQATLLLQIKAEIAGCPIKVPQITEAAATGAALLAGMGANIFRSGEEAASSVLHTVQIYEPDTQTVEIYNTIYRQIYLPARRLFI